MRQAHPWMTPLLLTALGVEQAPSAAQAQVPAGVAAPEVAPAGGAGPDAAPAAAPSRPGGLAPLTGPGLDAAPPFRYTNPPAPETPPLPPPVLDARSGAELVARLGPIAGLEVSAPRQKAQRTRDRGQRAAVLAALKAASWMKWGRPPRTGQTLAVRLMPASGAHGSTVLVYGDTAYLVNPEEHTWQLSPGAAEAITAAASPVKAPYKFAEH